MEVYIVVIRCFLFADDYPSNFIQGVYMEEAKAQEYVDNFNSVRALPINYDKPYKIGIVVRKIIE